MSFRRVGWVVAIALASVLEISCGQVYRPVVIPVNNAPPNPENFHAVFGIAANAPFSPGTAFQIDVSGDTNIGEINAGVNPTHAAILPNNSRVFVASAGSLFAGDTDVVTAFFPAGDSSTATGLGNATVFTLPNVGANQTSGILSISESGSVVTMILSTALINPQVGTSIVVSGVVASGANPSGYDGSFTITSVSGTTVQYVDCQLVGNTCNPVTGLLPVTTPGGSATIPVPLYCSYQPDFVATTQATAVYVANYGQENGANCNFSSTDSIATLSPVSGTITNIRYFCPAPTSVNCPSGVPHPVGMVETPNGLNLYVLNQSLNSVTDISPTDLSTIGTPIPVGNSPTWAVSRPDGLRLYVVTQGDGQLYTIRTDTNTVIPGSPQSLGVPGANFVLYDKSRNRLYVTNPSVASVFVYDATTDPPTPLGNATDLTIPLPSSCTGTTCTTPCSSATCTAVMPVGVAALPDGSRFYVASYVTPCAQFSGNVCVVPGPCPDGVTAAGCVIPQVTVFDAAALTIKSTIFPLLTPVTTTTGTTTTTTNPYALAPAAFCAPVFPSPWTPASARFRMFAAASEEGSRVYASLCDGGSVAIINTTTATIATDGNNTPDLLVTDLLAPFSAAPPVNGEPPPQTPVFLLTGQ
jgi:DNA-binding beta-propeller fold protein YncE